MAANFESQASTNYKEAFSLFDKRGNGRVALDSLGDLLRACGQNPTLAEIRDLEKNVGGECELAILCLFRPALPPIFIHSTHIRHFSTRATRRYMMYPVSHGTRIMVRSPVGRWTMPDVETALAKVLTLEQRNADA